MAKTQTLLDRTFDEGVALTVEARNCGRHHEQSDRRQMNLPDCLHLGYHHTRFGAAYSGDDVAACDEGVTVG